MYVRAMGTKVDVLDIKFHSTPLGRERIEVLEQHENKRALAKLISLFGARGQTLNGILEFIEGIAHEITEADLYIKALHDTAEDLGDIRQDHRSLLVTLLEKGWVEVCL